ncbi:MAG TPA: serpin family protein [Bacteroidales bacterium]|nr:serpin family protein [Bacteroidales bacterium]
MKILPFFLLALLPLAPGCSRDDDAPETVPPIVLTEKQQAVVNAGNAFGFNMLRSVDQAFPGENYMISPLSISAALGMTWNGALGQTAQQMQDVLGFQGLSAQEVNESYQKLLGYLLSSDPKVSLEIANSIWYRDGFQVLPSFIAVNQTYFNAEVIAANFGDPATVGQINAWVSGKTHGKITSIVDNIPELTMMYLINATYFKGDWTYRFREADTYTADFHLADGTVKGADMMNMKCDLEVLNSALVDGIRLPYGDGRYAMIALLPAQGVELNDVVTALEPSLWDQWLGGFAPVNAMEVHLPKFKFEKEMKLNDHLIGLGMPLAFVPGAADFGGINPQEELYIDEVKHKVYIDVNEKGTEAAAVTSVSIGVTSAGPYLMFNRPFLFFIVEKHTGYVLFAGKVAEPNY